MIVLFLFQTSLLGNIYLYDEDGSQVEGISLAACLCIGRSF